VRSIHNRPWPAEHKWAMGPGYMVGHLGERSFITVALPPPYSPVLLFGPPWSLIRPSVCVAMGTQLPVDARGAAAAILAFSILCLTTSLLLIWLVWVQNERRSCKT